MMVTVLLGLLSGVGWISVPFPEKIASNSDCSHTSSILMVLGDPWNLTLSDLHSFFSLCVDDGKSEGGRNSIRELSVPIKDLLDLHLGFLLIRL